MHPAHRMFALSPPTELQKLPREISKSTENPVSLCDWPEGAPRWTLSCLGRGERWEGTGNTARGDRVLAVTRCSTLGSMMATRRCKRTRTTGSHAPPGEVHGMAFASQPAVHTPAVGCAPGGSPHYNPAQGAARLPPPAASCPRRSAIPSQRSGWMQEALPPRTRAPVTLTRPSPPQS